MEVVDGWKAALRKAADISGLTFKQNTSDHGELLERLVEKVWTVVKWVPLEVATRPVGLDQACDDFERKIDLNEHTTKVVGIVGLGGSGKSSLAKHLFNLKRNDFKRSCYLSHVRKENGLTSLQRQLLRDLLDYDMNISNTDVGKTILRDTVRGLKVLIVLDDVDNGRDIESLLDIDAVGPGSLILITCRDKNTFKGSSANILVYDVNPLQKKHAKELFCRHAFRQSKPFEGYEALVEKFLKFCGGLPLSLKVLGEQLSGNLNITYWEEQFEMLSQGLSLPQADAVINTLKVSYKAMDIEEQGIFLDIGCFFVGEDKELTVRVLEGLGYSKVHYCLESLRQKYLLDFDNHEEYHHEIESRGQDHHPFFIQTPRKYRDTYVDVESYLPAVLPQGSSKISMQNQVRELARNIAREHLYSSDKQPLRLSRIIDIVKMLQLQDGSDCCSIRGIRIPKGQDPPQLTNKIKGVRLLAVEHPIERSFFGSTIEGKLVWLRLRNFGCISIPSTISQQSLRVLEFQGPIDHVEELFKHLKNINDEIPRLLSELNIDHEGETTASTSNSCQLVDFHHSMESSDKNISSAHERLMPSFYCFLEWIGTDLTKLNKIVLKNVPFLQSLPNDFFNLKCLRHLNLSGLTHLTKLPTSFSKLSRLQHLALRDCENLSIPDDILGEITTLEYIDLKGCAQLEHLPCGVAKQTRLRYLNLLDTSLLELPLNLELLGKVEQLRIGSPQLTKLPGSMASLKGLKELILSGCSTLDDITPIEKLKHLEILEIYESTEHLPPGIVELKNIKVLTIQGYSIAEFSFQTHADVVNHDVMDSLRDFTLRNTSITNIHIPTKVFPRLEIVDLSYSLQLLQVQGFPLTLVRLSLESCSRLKALTNLSNLVNLKFLNINGCEELETMNVEGLRSLEEICAEKCWKLQSIEAFEDLELVNSLRVSTSLDGRDFDTKVMQFIANSSEHLTDLRSVPATTTVKSPVILNNVLSQSAILMCFITNRVSRNGFCVCFEPSNDLARYEYKTVRRDGSSGRMLHMYLWTKDSSLFKDENSYNKVAAYASGSGNELDAGFEERG